MKIDSYLASASLSEDDEESQSVTNEPTNSKSVVGRETINHSKVISLEPSKVLSMNNSSDCKDRKD